MDQHLDQIRTQGSVPRIPIVEKYAKHYLMSLSANTKNQDFSLDFIKKKHTQFFKMIIFRDKYK